MVAYASTWPITWISTGTSLVVDTATVTGTSPPAPFFPPLPPPPPGGAAAPVVPVPEQLASARRINGAIPAAERIQKRLDIVTSVRGGTDNIIGYPPAVA